MQCMMLVVQDAAKKPFIGLVHQLINIRHVRWRVMAASTPPYKPSDSLKIGASYKSPPRKRCVHQSRHQSGIAIRCDTIEEFNVERKAEYSA